MLVRTKHMYEVKADLPSRDYRFIQPIMTVMFTLGETCLDLQSFGESNGAVTSITVISSE